MVALHSGSVFSANKPIQTMIVESEDELYSEDAYLDYCLELRQRLHSNDEALEHLKPRVFAYANEDLEEAFQEALMGCVGNRVVRKVTLDRIPNLPSALRRVSGLLHLEQLVVNDHKMVTLPLPRLTSLFLLQRPTRNKGLCRVKVATRVSMETQKQVEDLASSLVDLRHLEILSLRLSSQNPSLVLDPVLSACSCLPRLERLHLRFTDVRETPMFEIETLEAFLRDAPALQRLELDNMGLEDDHAVALSRPLRNNSTLLSLDLSRNPEVGFKGHMAFRRALVHNVTLQKFVSQPTSTGRLRQLQEDIQKQLLLHRLSPTTTPEQWLEALERANEISVDALFSILRRRPTLCQTRQLVVQTQVPLEVVHWNVVTPPNTPPHWKPVRPMI